MTRVIFGIFIILHGLVHLLYFGQSLRYFELQSGMVWPDDSWLFSGHLEIPVIRTLIAIWCSLVGAGFIISGIGFFLLTGWWCELLMLSALWSVSLFVVSWNGHLYKLDDQGGYSIVINFMICFGMVLWNKIVV